MGHYPQAVDSGFQDKICPQAILISSNKWKDFHVCLSSGMALALLSRVFSLNVSSDSALKPSNLDEIFEVFSWL